MEWTSFVEEGNKYIFFLIYINSMHEMYFHFSKAFNTMFCSIII